MQLKDFADLATALSLVVGALTFVFAFVDKAGRDRRTELLSWQRVIVYKIIEEGGAEFEDIKIRYVIAAQQFADFKIPKKEIQDGALKLVLLSLMEARLISRTDEGTFVVNVVSLHENMFKDLAVAQMHKQLGMGKIMSALYELLDRESGAYTIDQLYRRVNAQELGQPFEDFNVLVRDLINRGILVIGPEQKIWLRAKVPQRSASNPAKT